MLLALVIAAAWLLIALMALALCVHARSCDDAIAEAERAPVAEISA